jgi:hypothetical protein
MEISVFTDKTKTPDDIDLQRSLGKTSELWQLVRDYVCLKYPKAREEWNYTSDKYGWSFRIKDKKRAILYFLPRENYFKVAFVFGQKATDKIMLSQISEEIKKELEAARVYAEGRGIRIKIQDDSVLNDMKALIDIKLEH